MIQFFSRNNNLDTNITTESEMLAFWMKIQNGEISKEELSEIIILDFAKVQLTGYLDLSLFPSLYHLCLASDHNLEIDLSKGHKNLKKLHLIGCDMSGQFDLSLFPALNHLELANYSELKIDLTNKHDNLKELHLNNCGLSGRFDFNMLPSLAILHLVKVCNFNINLSKEHENLERLKLYDCDMSGQLDLSLFPLLNSLDLASNPKLIIDLSKEHKNLKKLHLASCYLSGPLDLSLFPALNYFYPRFNPELEIDLSKGHKNLKDLKLTDYDMSGQFDLSLFPALNYFTLTNNPKLEIDLSKEHKNLKELRLASCYLSGPFDLSLFPALNYLDLSNNPKLEIDLSKKHDNISLIRLKSCTLPKSIDLSNFPKLYFFDISQSCGTDHLTGSIEALENIDVRHSELTNISPKLIRSMLKKNFMFIDSLVRWKTGSRFDIKGCPLPADLKEILLSNDHERISAYLDLIEEGTVPLNEARVMFLGHGDAGKTHTIHRLIWGVDPEESPAQTESLETNYWDNNYKTHPEEYPNIRFWDFAGQEDLYSTHKCFLTGGCLYVVVLRARTSTGYSSLTQQARFWLYRISSFSTLDNTQLSNIVILAINREADDARDRATIDQETLSREFPNLVLNDPVFYSAKTSKGYASLSNNNDFKKLTTSILKSAAILETSNRKVPKSYISILDSLEKHTDTPSEPDAFLYNFNQACAVNGISDSAMKDVLKIYLSTLGICYLLKKSDDSYQMVETKWLTKAWYSLINYPKRATKNGLLERDAVYEYFSKSSTTKNGNEIPQLSKNQVDIVLEAMQQRELCYEVIDSEEDETSLFVPALLPKGEPKPYKNPKILLQMRLDYAHVPSTFIHTLMIKCVNNLVRSKCRNETMVVSYKKGHHITVSTKNTSNNIFIEVSCNQSTTPSLWDSGIQIVLSNIRETNRSLGESPAEYYLAEKNQDHKTYTAELKVQTLINFLKAGQAEYLIESKEDETTILKFDILNELKELWPINKDHMLNTIEDALKNPEYENAQLLNQIRELLEDQYEKISKHFPENQNHLEESIEQLKELTTPKQKPFGRIRNTVSDYASILSGIKMAIESSPEIAQIIMPLIYSMAKAGGIVP